MKGADQEGVNDEAYSLYSGEELQLQIQLLGSIPNVVTRHGSKESTGYTDNLSVRCRHATRLLQRSPYCPMVTAAKQGNAEMQVRIDRMGTN